ncbi:MAG TPA: ABC transporter permease [Gemmatimonadaceae bacterium]|nr:ABC transporter permease [Gemmatimonadaceae bacterium]
MRDQPPRKRGARLLPPKPEAEVDDELAFHLEQRVRDYVARGMDPDTARRAAEARFGDVGGVRRECAELLGEDRRATSRRDWLGDLRQDVRFGVRSALRSPLFTLLAVVTLALGIGANAAVFGVVKSVLLDALPYTDADRLVRVYGRFLDGSNERGPLSAGTVHDIAERQRSFTQVAAFMTTPSDAVYGADEGPRAGRAVWVEPALFRTLGVSAVLGRTFVEGDIVGDTVRFVVLPHATWQQLFGGDSGVVGRDIRINGIARTVIGVLPRDFVGPVGEADFYYPLDYRPVLRDPVSARGSGWLGLVGRLKPGVTVDAARRELDAIGEALAREYPRDNGSIRLATMSLRDAMVGDTRTPLLVLLASAGLVLLITCANLAGALLSRTLTRRKEFAVRVALGAGRGRLVRQLLTESLVLALAGGAAGIALAVGGLALLRGLASSALPSYAELALDPGAVLVTSLLALATGLLFGLAPAVTVGRANPQGTLRDEARGASESRRTRSLRGLLVAGQIALCVSLLVGAGLLARSLWAMTATPLGFVPDGVLVADLQLTGPRYRVPGAEARFQEEFTERLRALPGVRHVALASARPGAVGSRNGFTIVGRPWPSEDVLPFVLYASVTDDYFRTLGIPLRQGRTFGPSERADSPPAIVISEAMARRYWPDGDAVGSRIRMGPDPNSTPIEVIGVVGDVRNDPTRPDAEPMAYGSWRQFPWGSGMTLLVRAERDPLALVGPVRGTLRAMDPALPLDGAMTLRAAVGEGLAGRRLPVMLITAFGALALLLASVGVYALFASMAAAREREFGVRVALGSSRGAIAALVLRQGAVWMLLGLAGGAAGVVAVSRLLRGLLYGVQPFDPVTLAATAVILVVCAAVALLVPVRRATHADPIAVLR